MQNNNKDIKLGGLLLETCLLSSSACQFNNNSSGNLHPKFVCQMISIGLTFIKIIVKGS